MNFLQLAQQYAEAQGDDYWFAHWYTVYREEFNVRDSVYTTLVWLYDTDTANRLEQEAV